MYLLYTVYCVLYTALYSIVYLIHTVYLLYAVYCVATIHSVLCTFYTLCTVYSESIVHCVLTVHSVQFTSKLCILCTSRLHPLTPSVPSHVQVESSGETRGGSQGGLGFSGILKVA